MEGPEGSGKSTQALALVARLRDLGYEVVQTREPGGTPTGEAIRDILQHDAAGEPLCSQAETLLFAASRAQLVRNVILPALERGACVVSDRFVDSTIAYQGYGRGFGVDDVMSINSFAIDGAIPELTVLLDVDVSLGFERLEARHRERGQQRDRMEAEHVSFHEKVREGYLDLAGRWPDRIKVVDGAGSEEDVAEEVWVLVSRILDCADAASPSDNQAP